MAQAAGLPASLVRDSAAFPGLGGRPAREPGPVPSAQVPARARGDHPGRREPCLRALTRPLGEARRALRGGDGSGPGARSGRRGGDAPADPRPRALLREDVPPPELRAVRADRPVGRTRWDVHQRRHADPLDAHAQRRRQALAQRRRQRAQDRSRGRHSVQVQRAGRVPPRALAGRRRGRVPLVDPRLHAPRPGAVRRSGRPLDAPRLHGDGLQQVGNDERDRRGDDDRGLDSRPREPLARALRLQAAPPRSALSKFVKENASAGFHFFADRVRAGDASSADDLRPGEGAIVGRVRKTAVYRDDDGTVHELSPVCRHLWCVVDWNPAERTWDCPCHGSRYAADGRVLEGPTTEDLKRKLVARQEGDAALLPGRPARVPPGAVDGVEAASSKPCQVRPPSSVTSLPLGPTMIASRPVTQWAPDRYSSGRRSAATSRRRRW